MSLGKGGGKAGADLTSCLFPTVIFSASVISSSSCGTAEPPSHVTSHGAEQVGNLWATIIFRCYVSRCMCPKLRTSAAEYTGRAVERKCYLKILLVE